MPNGRRRNRAPVVGSVVASIPIALGLAAGVTERAPAAATARARGTPKEFSVPLASLRDWSRSVIVKLDDVVIDDNSRVHTLANDCEIHFGAHSVGFQGSPDGLVLEPMNACVHPFPGKDEQDNKDWLDFAKEIKNAHVGASGVPRIWPEHLEGGSLSNPDHAVELHPLTAIDTGTRTVDFAPGIFAGDYSGGVTEPTALAIARNTTVSVTRNGSTVDVSFRGGRIGNFTVLALEIERASIESDGAGSFRMNGNVVMDSGSVPVRIVTVKGSPINNRMSTLTRSRSAQIELEALVLFSLSPESLLAAAQRSNGSAVAVQHPLQLILYGTPDDQ